MRTTFAGAAIAIAAVLTLTACGGSGDAGDKPAADVSVEPTKAGAIVLDAPKAKPDLVLTDTSEKKFELVKETKGHPVLLYFGYTYCPDVCSTVVSDIAAAEKKLSKADQEKLRVVFVTTDPERDTPKRMREWLDAQGGQDIVGLTGDFATIQAAAKPLGILVEPPKKEKDGSVTVSHGAEVVGFSPKDDGGHWIYTASTTSEQYAKDLPKIVKGENP
ncbi:SCO family protein [Streptomyces triculaminicus]|uniref:SCO family protein n=2 Tax=Streptomyces TaxID=1883 RepID=A0A939FJ59_9ACTN|nr:MULTISPECIES: SCO family protein [Streptomyces]MBO0652433.1 SCO family protein [Streptomyces triculaminicus]QSY51960.1 SCO family protein [Streptomyces griseocarneus]